ncbi:hypothetical protein GCM10029992_53150 [Glycomyces albus]
MGTTHSNPDTAPRSSSPAATPRPLRAGTTRQEPRAATSSPDTADRALRPRAGSTPPIPPPSGGGGGGLALKILGAVGSIVLIAAIALVKVFVLDGDDGGSNNAGTNTLSNDEADAAEQAEVGDCMPQNYGSGTGEEIVVDCGDELAFWTITKVDNDAAVPISAGDVTDFQDAVDICGENVYARIPGEVWLDYNFVEVEGTTEQFFCLEAIQEQNAEGQLPKVPTTGECFDDAADWWTVDCSSATAIGEVVDAIPVSPLEQDMSQSDAQAMAGQCSGGEVYWQVEDQLGRTGGILCGNEL